jgi:four helix bundle protein
MFLNLKHKQLDIYKVSRELTKECYRITTLLPDSEKFNLISQIRRAALSVKLNLAEGSSRKSKIERNRYYEISRGSVIEIDAALEVAFDLKLLTEKELAEAGVLLNKCFAMLTKLIS